MHDQSTRARFWARIDTNGPIPEHHPQLGRCWLQVGYTDKWGYGSFRVNNRSRRMHHIAWEIASGAPVPDGLFVLHACDNPGCARNDEPGTYLVNGSLLPRLGHLFLGTLADNIRDRDEKGRTAHVGRKGYGAERAALGKSQARGGATERICKGEFHHQAKLTEVQVRALRRRYDAGGVSARALAIEEGLPVMLVWRVVTHRTWQHVA